MHRALALVALVAVALGAVASMPAPAAATPLLDPSVGGPVFTGPTSPHVSSLFWNPAAIGLLGGTHFTIDGALRLDQTTIDRASISPGDGEPGSGTSFESISSTPITLGGFAGFITDVGTERISFGLATYPLYRVQHIEDEDALAYHADGGSYYGWETTLGLSLRASRTLYFGAGFSFLLSRLDLRYRRDLGLETCAAAPCSPGIEDPTNAQRHRIQLSQGFDDLFDEPAISYSLGVLAKISGWWFGLSWFSAPLSASGVVTRSADAEVSGAGLDRTVRGDARVSFGLPAMIHFGARRNVIDGYDLVINLRWASLSAHDAYDVRLIGSDLREEGLPEWTLRYRGFADIFSVEAGMENGPGAPVRVGGRLRFETSAVAPSRVSPSQIDATKLSLLLGGEVRITKAIAITAGYSLTFMAPQTVDDSVFSPGAAIECNASGHAFESCEDVRLGRAIPTAAGDYSRLSHDVHVGVSLDLWP